MVNHPRRGESWKSVFFSLVVWAVILYRTLQEESCLFWKCNKHTQHQQKHLLNSAVWVYSCFYNVVSFVYGGRSLSCFTQLVLVEAGAAKIPVFFSGCSHPLFNSLLRQFLSLVLFIAKGYVGSTHVQMHSSGTASFGRQKMIPGRFLLPLRPMERSGRRREFKV